MLSKFGEWIRQHVRVLAYAFGSGLVGVWTVVRHLTNGVNFDVVGQIGVAEQWAQGLQGGAQFGATNYLLKMPVYWLVNTVDVLSPHGKLLLLALVFNIATFALTLYLFERCLHLYRIRPSIWFYAAMVLLGSISARVYWLDYANSRNLETAGGVAVLYVALLLLQRVTFKRLAALIGLGGIVFFADPLQIYVIGGGLLLYMGLRWVHTRTVHRLQQAAWVGGGVAGAFALAKSLMLLAVAVLPVTFLVAPRGDQSLSLGTVAQTIQGILSSTARVFDVSFYSAASAPNALRQLLNLALFGCLLWLLIAAWRRRLPQGLSAVAICCIVAAYGVYALSGQALLPQTERYLIMVPILAVLLVGSIGDTVRWARSKQLQIGWAAALCICAVLAVGALAISWPQHYSKDAYIGALVGFMHEQGSSYAVASRDGIPATYFAERTAIIVPVICLPDRTLVLSNLFYDRAAFADRAKQTDAIPLIVSGEGIHSSGSTCTVQDIERQFGTPLRSVTVVGYGTALFYPAAQLQLHE